ncbi:hypothetical protein [Lacisediminimonas profundi]|uniref:hypothetical protein n=1 Tax=Lacisediminimonas profundi TaxID=2603856 RepID=UPI00124BBB56|nr:hypothetical protein [Lacisediminimonas profundi]
MGNRKIIGGHRDTPMPHQASNGESRKSTAAHTNGATSNRSVSAAGLNLPSDGSGARALLAAAGVIPHNVRSSNVPARASAGLDQHLASARQKIRPDEAESPPESAFQPISGGEAELPSIDEIHQNVSSLLKSWQHTKAGKSNLESIDAFLALGRKAGKSPQDARKSLEDYLNVGAMLAFTEATIDLEGSPQLQRPGRGRELLSAMQEFIGSCRHGKAPPENADAGNVFAFCDAFQKLDEASEAEPYREGRWSLASPTLEQTYPWSEAIGDVARSVQGMQWDDWDS